jgi:zinc transport system substrate-binding protein
MSPCGSFQRNQGTLWRLPDRQVPHRVLLCNTIMRIRTAATLLALVLSFAGISHAAPPGYSAATSVESVAAVMREVGAGFWQVRAMTPAGQDPHLFTLRPEEAAAFHAAKIYLAVGMEADPVLIARAPKGMTIVRVLPDLEAEDPHLWLDPEGLAAIACASRDAFAGADPAHSAEYAAACASFLDRLAGAAEKARGLLAPYAGRSFVVHHGAFTRYAAAFALHQVALEVEEKEPSAAHLAEVTELVKREKIACLYAQNAHNPAPVEIVAKATGAQIRSLDSLPAEPVAAIADRAEILSRGFAAEDAQNAK